MVKRVVLLGLFVLAIGACGEDEPVQTASIGAVEEQLPRAETSTTTQASTTTEAPTTTQAPSTTTTPTTVATTLPPTTQATAPPTTRATLPPTTQPAPIAPVAAPSPGVYYANCSAARDAGAAPVRRGDPGYGTHLDRDNDGIGCE